MIYFRLLWIIFLEKLIPISPLIQHITTLYFLFNKNKSGNVGVRCGLRRMENFIRWDELKMLNLSK